jgi:hypothetical protein
MSHDLKKKLKRSSKPYKVNELRRFYYRNKSVVDLVLELALHAFVGMAREAHARRMVAKYRTPIRLISNETVVSKYSTSA